MYEMAINLSKKLVGQYVDLCFLAMEVRPAGTVELGHLKRCNV